VVGFGFSITLAMSLRRKITIAVVLTIFGVVAYFGYGIIYTLQRIPEAYAAWDTGTLLVEYMKSHENRWPSSWDDLLSVVRSNSEDQVMFRGAKTGDTNYAALLRTKVSINWKFDPSRGGQSLPITRLDGTKFPIVWEGAEPNEMVHRYLTTSITNAPGVR
jgi:hypothetical protein